MAETVRAVEYFYVLVPDKPGEGARILGELNPAAFRAVATQNKWKVKGPKRAFVIEGDDRVGACSDLLNKLAAAKINVTAMDAVAVGAGRWGAILWVKPGAVKKTASVLGAM